MTPNYIKYDGNDLFYEWGQNCATLGYNHERTENSFNTFVSNPTNDDKERFWMGYNIGPRDNNVIYSLPAF